MKYMASFYGEVPIERMEPLLADNFTFKGPFFEFDSAEAYLKSLKTDTPIDVKYHILETYEKENSACLIYKFSKTGVETIMAQTFEVSDDKITKIELIFDTKAFAEHILGPQSQVRK